MASQKSISFKQKYQPFIHLNLNIRGLQPSATLAVNELSNSLLAQGKKVYKFGLGQSPFPVPENVVKALQDNAFQKDYLAVKGLYELREAIANKYLKGHGIEREAEDIIVGPGSKELLFLLQLVYYGELVIPSPSWVSYSPQAKIVGRNVQWLTTKEEDDWRLRPEDLTALCEQDPERPRIVILNYPNNPTGATYTLEWVKAIAQVARKYRLILLSDEIYGDLNHLGQHVSIARFYPEGTIVSTGLSKWCGAGGWRLGLFAFPPSLRWLLDAMASVASETFTATSAPIQYAAIRAFEGGEDIEAYLKDSRRILKVIGNALYKKLIKNHVSLPSPKGGFYLFPNFSHYTEKLHAKGIHSSRDFCRQLLEETGVAILPASDFGIPANELIARMAYVNFDGTEALKVAQTEYANRSLDVAFLEKCCAETMEGVDVLVEWLKK
ncbi:MAG: aminotransferase class I/II-fold pyridoxal phosphate-dependent enzyme [Chitinophagales bacterium]